MNVSIDTFPSVPFNRRNNLPSVSAIYFVLTTTNDVLYIGKSRFLKARWKGHKLTSYLEQQKDISIAWLECKRTELNINERFMINLFRPPLNKTMIGYKSPKKSPQLEAIQ